MKLKGNIVFLGMMGSGKTTIGKLISKKLKLDFIDIDLEIEKFQENQLIKYLKLDGETFLEKLKKKLL